MILFLLLLLTSNLEINLVESATKCYTCDICNIVKPLSDPIVPCPGQNDSVCVFLHLFISFGTLFLTIFKRLQQCATIITTLGGTPIISKRCMDSCVPQSVQSSSLTCCYQDACNRPNPSSTGDKNSATSTKTVNFYFYLVLFISVKILSTTFIIK